MGKIKSKPSILIIILMALLPFCFEVSADPVASPSKVVPTVNKKATETLAPKFKDPTEPSEGSSVKKEINPGDNIETTLDLESILLSGDRKIAVINNKIVKVNDVIGAYRVKEINITSVKLVPEGKQGDVVILRLLGAAIKETP